jgi:hypothetical protein
MEDNLKENTQDTVFSISPEKGADRHDEAKSRFS